MPGRKRSHSVGGSAATLGLTGWEALAGHVGPAGCADSVSFRGGHFLLPCGQHLVERGPLLMACTRHRKERNQRGPRRGTGDTTPGQGFLVAAVPAHTPQPPDRPCKATLWHKPSLDPHVAQKDKS